MPLLRPFNPPLRVWPGQTVWIIGASSGIGAALAQALLAAGARVVVSARQVSALQALAQGHARCRALALDVTDADAVGRAASALLAQGALDCVVYCAADYTPMRAQTLDVAVMRRHMAVNYLGALAVLDAVLPSFRARERGHLCLIGSVAGYVGLPNSLAYGPTKAALINLAEALYVDLHPTGLGVSIVNPGFVQTPLTAQNDFHMPALLTPAQAAQAIVQGWARGQFEIHFPRRFTLWLKLLRCLPYRLSLPLLQRLVPPDKPKELS